MIRLPVAGLVVALAACIHPVLAQSGVESIAPREVARSYTDPEARMAGYAAHVELVDGSPHGELKWSSLGPTNLSGRVTDVAIPEPRDRTPFTMFVAGASGGVWRTRNEGTTWEPVFEHGASTSIGDVTIAPSDHDVVWIGTGEANIFRSSFAGCGVYRSTDGGDTWQHRGLAGTHTVARIVIHPERPDVVYVAASGHEWTDNPERGVYQTTDGGDTWQQVLFVGERTGAIDLVMDPRDPETLYASTWQRIRRRWNDPRNEDGYDQSGIHKTTDGGRTWRPINDGLPPAAVRGRIGIDLCRSQPDVLYAFVDNYTVHSEGDDDERDSYGRRRGRVIHGAEVYRSDDAGASWQMASESNDSMRRLSGTYGWVFGQVRVDPVDPEVVYVMGLALNVSRDGGKTFSRLGGMHGDHHALWIDPANPRLLINGNDGGANVSYDGGENWRLFVEDLPMVQFFNVGIDLAEPFRVYGSIQDHGSYRAEVVRRRGRFVAQEWQSAPGGEGSSHAIDPTDPDTVYSAGFYGQISRTDMKSGERENIVPKPADGEPPLRGQWLAPFIVSPHNPRIIYHGMNRLFRSWDRGDVFEAISPDLTYADPDQLGDIPYQTIFTIAESPLKFGRLYVGTDDGRAWTTPDGGGRWDEITAGLADHRWVSRVEASRFSDGVVYLAQNGKRNDDFTPYLWKSTDHGSTWQSIVANLPLGPINVVREDPKDASLLFVGTDLGVYVSQDGGGSWATLSAGLPTTFVADLQVHPRDGVLVAATHGRGMYAVDITSLRDEGSDESRGLNADDPGRR